MAASLFAACSDTAYYPLCTEDCASGGAAGPGSFSGGSGGAAGADDGTSDAGRGGGVETPPAGGAGGSAGAGGTDDPIGDAGSPGGDGGAAGAAGERCDPALSPVDEPCLVNDAFAVFARANEDSGKGDGSLGNPFGTLSQAIDAAEAQGKYLVIACLGTFRKPLEISRAGGPTLRIVGGFECSSGKANYVGTPTAIEATTGASLLFDGANDVELVDLELRSLDAKLPETSSIAAIVSDSSNIVLRRVRLFAGEGLDGLDGAESPARVSEAPSGIPGTVLGGGSAQAACSCAGTVGGRGGDLSAASTRDGSDGQPALGAGQGGPGGDSCKAGSPGAAPAGGAAGKNAASHGVLNGATWEPAAGTAGEDGAIGQGGGGGGGGPSGGGGSGGCGGCGGKGGAAGTGGGASIGLLAIDSQISVIDSFIETRGGGAGGDGQAGQPGQPPGGGGPGAATGCRGGVGGSGSNGGPGGGGSGGLSAGIAYQGAAPLLESDDSRWLLGPAGPGGRGGDGETAGIDGASQSMLELLIEPPAN